MRVSKATVYWFHFRLYALFQLSTRNAVDPKGLLHDTHEAGTDPAERLHDYALDLREALGDPR
jgi:hypothetical protein